VPHFWVFRGDFLILGLQLTVGTLHTFLPRPTYALLVNASLRTPRGCRLSTPGHRSRDLRVLRSRRRDTHRAFPGDDVGARVIYRRVSAHTHTHTHLRPGERAAITFKPRSAKPRARSSPSNAWRGRSSRRGGAVRRACTVNARSKRNAPVTRYIARPTEPYRVLRARDVKWTSHRRRDIADRTEAGAPTFKPDSRSGSPISYRPRITKLVPRSRTSRNSSRSSRPSLSLSLSHRCPIARPLPFQVRKVRHGAAARSRSLAA